VPYRATRNVHAMLAPGGYFMVSVPFLIRGPRLPDRLLALDRARPQAPARRVRVRAFEAGRTGSWGNRASIKASFRSWRSYIPWLHSLQERAGVPAGVWALARK